VHDDGSQLVPEVGDRLQCAVDFIHRVARLGASGKGFDSPFSTRATMLTIESGRSFRWIFQSTLALE
jgi:hypothetical protein